MNETNTTHLIESYPRLYSNVNGTPQETLMCFGFEVGDGWFNIIDELSAKIEAYNHTVDTDYQCVAIQVKEKYGTLRFYVMGGDSYIDELIDNAELLSEKTCEECGAPGTLRVGGWRMVRCEKCNQMLKGVL